MTDESLEAAEEYPRVARRAWGARAYRWRRGNMSVRVVDLDLILVKPSGRSNIECNHESLLQVDLTGDVISGEGQPSQDLNFHLAIYRGRPDVSGIVHAYVPWATSLTFLGQYELPLLTPHAFDKLGRVPIIPYHPSGTHELESAVGMAFSNSQDLKAVPPGKHGMIAAGSSLTAAEEVAELVEETAKVGMLVRFATNSREGEHE